MRLCPKICVAVFASVLLIGNCDVADAQEDSKPTTYRPKIDDGHPDIVLPRIDNGKPLKLSDYRGKKVLLIHFASW